MPPFRLSVAFAVLLFAGIGCGKKDSAAPTTPNAGPPEISPVVPTPPTAAPTAGAEDTKASALKAATDFLKAVLEGAVPTENLTQEFKKTIAPPQLEAEKANGYSDVGTREWFAKYKAITSSVVAKAESAEGDVVFVSSPVPNKGTFFLRLLRTGSTWKIDAFCHGLSQYEIPASPFVQTAQRFAVICFCEALASKDLPVIQALMTKKAKGKIAPPLFDSDREQGYSATKLVSAFVEIYLRPYFFKSHEQIGDTARYLIGHQATNSFLEVLIVPGATPASFLIDGTEVK